MLLKQPEETKLDPRIKRTRHLLQQALMELMGEKSFQAITIQDIADRATVNRATFYAHFEDKEALLEHTIRDGIKQRLHSRLPEDSQFNQENLAQLILTVCEFLAEMGHCPPPHRQFEPLMEKQVKGELYEILQVWLRKMPTGKSNHRTPPELAAMVTSWAIYGAAAQWSQQAQREPAGEFVQQVLPLILAGLQTSATLSKS